MAAEPHAVKAHYAGGTISGLAPKADARLDVTQQEVLIFQCNTTTVRVPYRKVNTLEYGQNVSRRYAAAVLVSPVLLLSKSRKHFVTVGFIDEQGQQQALVFQVGKGEIRSILASLEARSGRKVEYTDDEARKSGRD